MFIKRPALPGNRLRNPRRFVPLAIVTLLLVCTQWGFSQQLPLSQRMADDTMQRWPAGRFVTSGSPWVWNYELGTLLDGMDAVWYNTAKGKYFRYIQSSIDLFIGPDGSIQSYDPKANSLDNILLGRQLLLLYRVTSKEKYYKAAKLLRDQLSAQPRDASGGFWHKQIYPDQMWLDGLYMAEPFYAEYASVFQEPADFADITKQFVLIEQHARDAKTGLLYHGWDESKKQSWANKVTGDSPEFWARGMGWYMMALVDTLQYYPQNDPGRAQLLAILNRTAAAVVHYQDAASGLWYQVPDKPHAQGNYLESSAACMFTYALAKGVRLGYLPTHYSANALHAWKGIQKHFLQSGADGTLTLTGTVKGIGLGGQDSTHDGSYHYYVTSPVVSNDPKGVGAFLLAATEMELAPDATIGRGDKVVIDAWFNSQTRKNAAGQTISFHYKWNDYTNDGFSLFGHIWRSYGVATDTLNSAPTAEKLKGAQFYIIASPDIPVKNPNPHYVEPTDAAQVAEWVKQGGILVMMENDPANADIAHLDELADRFGIHFNTQLAHHVIGEQIESGTIPVKPDGNLFHEAHTLYMKDTSTITVSGPAKPLLEDRGTIVMATAKFGKGTVFAVVDPWVYNEYTDGRKPQLPSNYDNFEGGKELVRWLLQQLPPKGKRHSHIN
jgi:unsaturated rhamnogalacturonyl hydrolase